MTEFYVLWYNNRVVSGTTRYLVVLTKESGLTLKHGQLVGEGYR